MTIAVVSYIPERVIYIYTDGIVSNDEFFDMDAACGQLLDHSAAPLVHFIFDQQTMAKMPPIQVQSKVKSGRHPRLGWLILISQDNVLNRFVSVVVTNLFKVRLRYVSTFTDAVQFLQYVDTTLPDLNTLEYRQRIRQYIPLDAHS
jgi:hypothetical protein